MKPEIREAYRAAAVPFAGMGATDANGDILRSWRYFLEINSACNLSCIMCTKGNKTGYDHQNGVMADELMQKIIDKIASENPKAIVFLYGNSEPFLHPRLPECIAAIKRRGLRCEFASNLNYMQRVDETIEAAPDMMIVSLSGFTQEVYEKSHCGGKIDKVKANMVLLGEANAKAHKPVHISVNFHVYADNQHEIEPMREYAAKCGLGFFTSTARAISMENTLQQLRELEELRTGQPVLYAMQDGRPDWNKALPPVTEKFKETWDRLTFRPDQAQQKYHLLPVHPVCPVGDMFTFIRHDGKTSLCACVADRRISLTDYLETSQEELSEQRRGHAICQQCLKYRMSYYFHNVEP